MKKKYLVFIIGGLLIVSLGIAIPVFMNINKTKEEQKLREEKELMEEKEDQEKKKGVEERRENNRIYKRAIEKFSKVLVTLNYDEVNDFFNSLDYHGVLAWQNINGEEDKFNDEYIQVEDALKDWSKAADTTISGGTTTIRTFLRNLIQEKSYFQIEFDDSIKYSELEGNNNIHVVKTKFNIKAINKNNRFTEQNLEKIKEFTFVFYKGKIIDIQLSDDEGRTFSLFYYFTNKNDVLKTKGRYVYVPNNLGSLGILVCDFYKSFNDKEFMEIEFKDNGELIFTQQDEIMPKYSIKGTYKVEEKVIKILLNSEAGSEEMELEAYLGNNKIMIKPMNFFRYYIN